LLVPPIFLTIFYEKRSAGQIFVEGSLDDATNPERHINW